MKYDFRQNLRWRPGGGCTLWVLSSLVLRLSHYRKLFELTWHYRLLDYTGGPGMASALQKLSCVGHSVLKDDLTPTFEIWFAPHWFWYAAVWFRYSNQWCMHWHLADWLDGLLNRLVSFLRLLCKHEKTFTAIELQKRNRLIYRHLSCWMLLRGTSFVIIRSTFMHFSVSVCSKHDNDSIEQISWALDMH